MSTVLVLYYSACGDIEAMGNAVAEGARQAGALAAKPSGALRASKRLMKSAFVDQIEAAMALENKEYSVLTRSRDAKEAFAASLEKRAPDFNWTRKTTPVA
jgi:enoyl-CoA hydratase/carnithine racemase